MPQSDGLPQPARFWAAAAVWLALLLAVLDTSIANVALPTIAQDIGATPADSIWVINAYQIAITMLLLPIAAAGERLGFRRIYLFGIALFVLASLSCTLARDLTELAISRFIQGIGAACLMAVNGALVRLIYPRAILGRGVGYNALVVAAGSAAGPSIAAAVLAIGSWRWLFAINLPVGLLALLISFVRLPHGGGGTGRFDWTKAVLVALAFAMLFLGSSGVAHGQSPVLSGLELVSAIGLFALLVRLSRADPTPLVPVDLLRIPVLCLSYATSICSFVAQMSAFVALPFLLEARFGFDRVTIGLLMTPWPVATAICAPVAGRLVERFPAALLGGIGLALTAAGLATLVLLPARPHAGLVVAAMILCGTGFGLFQTPNNRTMLGNAPPHRSGAAAGMLATSRLVGQTAGALLVALLFHRISPGSGLPLALAAGAAGLGALLSIQRKDTSLHKA